MWLVQPLPGTAVRGSASSCARRDPVAAILVGLANCLERWLKNANKIEILKAV